MVFPLQPIELSQRGALEKVGHRQEFRRPGQMHDGGPDPVIERIGDIKRPLFPRNRAIDALGRAARCALRAGKVASRHVLRANAKGNRATIDGKANSYPAMPYIARLIESDGYPRPVPSNGGRVVTSVYSRQ